jgi:hypothetical protein
MLGGRLGQGAGKCLSALDPSLFGRLSAQQETVKGIGLFQFINEIVRISYFNNVKQVGSRSEFLSAFRFVVGNNNVFSLPHFIFQLCFMGKHPAI